MAKRVLKLNEEDQYKVLKWMTTNSMFFTRTKGAILDAWCLYAEGGEEGAKIIGRFKSFMALLQYVIETYEMKT